MLPGADTLGWMALAAAAGFALTMSRGLVWRYHEWRLSRRLARGEDAYFEELRELEAYRPDALTEAEVKRQPVDALYIAAFLAGMVWIYSEADQDVAEISLAGVMISVSIFNLIRNLSKTDEELGLVSEDGNPMRGPPTFIQRHRKQLKELGGAILPLVFVLPILARNKFYTLDGAHLSLVMAIIIISGLLLMAKETNELLRSGTLDELEVDTVRMRYHLTMIGAGVVAAICVLFTFG